MSISEVKIGSIIRVKVGKNLIHAKVIQILEDGLRVCSLGKNKEFNVPSSRVEFDGGEAEQIAPAAIAPENVETGTEEQSGTAEHPEQPAEQEAAEPEEPATVEVLPEDEAAEFQPSGEDEEDEYAINPAHESDKPQKRMSLLNAAVEVLKAAGPDHPMNCKEILEAILERQLWTPTDCKTPEQTLYGSIFREISTKEHPRIVKSDVKGKFRIAE